MKEIKVQFFRDEERRGFELWRSEPINGKRYYLARMTSCNNEWCYVHDAPGGLCEPSHEVDDSITIVICDHTGKEIIRDGNDVCKYPETLLTFREECEIVWKNIVSNYPKIRKDSYQIWINTFNTIPNKDVDEWAYHHKETQAVETLHSFQWLNESYLIVRVCMKHNICNQCWWEYGIFKAKDKCHLTTIVNLGWEEI